MKYCLYRKLDVESCEGCGFVAKSNLEGCKAYNLREKKVREVVK